MAKRRGKSDFADEILLGMARGPWACAWASEREEEGESFSGMDIYAAAPDAPRWAAEWAERLAYAVSELNGQSLESLYRAAQEAGFARDRETFGYYLGMQATGAGVRWDDDLSSPGLKVRVPSAEFYEGAQPDLRFVKS
jgi:hypothetical protein